MMASDESRFSQQNMPSNVVRNSRFFPELDKDPLIRSRSKLIFFIQFDKDRFCFILNRTASISKNSKQDIILWKKIDNVQQVSEDLLKGRQCATINQKLIAPHKKCGGR